MTTQTKVIIGVAAVAAIGGGLFWVYKKKPQWLGIQSNPNQGSPAVGGAPTVQPSQAENILNGVGGIIKSGSGLLDSLGV